ncbi:PREDICTED: BEN domain-containing protein 5-like isoform X2 [Wasmannia auropunctata]|uniref:BEN domain-containing protein 5-like isoform X2 n=1 Tax=Wasmannia auropunctata TaxID=64793 RepID=UPI0005EE5CC3|nr:PREDICTED: BEN domain-containing protein 5-like isoform X2 [Wasmannia auropunctata]
MAIITHAYVRFLEDDVRMIVDIKDIKRFRCKNDQDFDKTRIYNVLWRPKKKPENENKNSDEDSSEEDKPAFYKANILLLGTSEEDVNKKLKFCRIKLPNKKLKYEDIYSDDELSDDSDDNNAIEKKKSKAVVSKKAAKEISKTILKKNKLKLCNDIVSSASEDENPKKENKKSEEENETSALLIKMWEQKYADLEEQFNHLKIEMMALKDENYRYKGLNIILQHYRLFGNTQVLGIKSVSDIEMDKTKPVKVENISGIKSVTDIEIDKTKPSVKIENDISDEPAIYVSNDINGEKMDIELVKEEFGNEKKIEFLPRYTIFKITRNDTKVNRIHLGDGVVIDLDVWEMIQTKRQDSRFVKDLAIAIWGRHVLINRSLDGKGGQRLPNQEEKRKILTPSKREVLKRK